MNGKLNKNFIPLAIVVAALIIAFAIFSPNTGGLSPEKAGDRAITFINENLLPPDTPASLVIIEEDSGIYKFEIDNILMMTTNNISVRGVYGYNQDIFKTAINLFAQKKIKIDPILTKHIKLEQVPEIFKILSHPPHEDLKILVDFD